MDKKILSNFALFFTALIWGLSFVAQKAGMEHIGPFSFNFARSILGGISLIPFIFIAKILKEDKRTPKHKHHQHLILTRAGISCGIALFTAMTIQQFSMTHATAGKAGFISSLYIIFVPVILSCFGEKLAKNIKISIGIALLGLYLLCFKGGSAGFDFYDILLLIAAFFYGVHIIVVNYFSKKIEAAKISCLQFFVVGLLSIPLMLLFETPHIAGFIACKIPIFYAGVLTCGVAYTLQIFGQKYSHPTIASLILCLESVFAVIGGGMILHESLSPKELLGCVFMISAVILSQLNYNSKKEQKQLSPLKEEKI